MRTVKECTEMAKGMMKNHKYLYGGKGQPYTKELVNKLANQYKSHFTAALKAEALKDADKGYIAGDCSYFICKIMNLPMINSTALKNRAVMKIRPQKHLAKEGMCLWKSGHVAYIGDDLKIYELRNTTRDATISSWEDRAKDFTYMFVVKDSPLYFEQQKSVPVVGLTYPRYTGSGHSIVVALLKVGEKDTSFAHRKQIAIKNGISTYRGTTSQNLVLVKLLKEGKLLKP